MTRPSLSPADATSRRSVAAAQSCSRCLYDSTIPGIEFDADGMCSFCQLHDAMEQQYPTGARGKQALVSLCDAIRQSGRGRPYDRVVAVSGGCGSSFLLFQIVGLGVRPFAAFSFTT